MLVAGTDVGTVEGTSVAVGGWEVSLGGTGVSVGEIGVFVSVGGGIGVFVSVGGGTGVFVLVGGRGVRDGVRLGMRVGVRVGMRVGGRVGVRTIRVGVLRGFLVIVGVMVTKRLGVSDGSGVRDGDSVPVGSGLRVAVGTNTVTTCSVSAAAVSRLETARSTIFRGAIVTEMARFRSPIAITDTLHNMLSPMAPATKIPKGPE